MPEQTHYHVLGIPETASLEEIKKQYRSLARKFHPDVNPGPQAAQQFSRIAEAYRVLSDTEARRTYDAERALQQRQASYKSAGPVNHPAGPRPAASSPPKPPPTTASQESERLVQQAQIAFTRNRMAEARSLAEQSLRYNRKNAVGWEILGDVCRNQERYDDALRHYTMASQLDPRSATIQQKIERIARKPSASGRSAAGGYTPSTPIRHSSPRPSVRTGPTVTSQLPEEKRSLAVVLAGFFGFFGTFLLLLLSSLFLDKTSASTQQLPIVFSWSWPYVACMSAAGALMGATMTITGMIRRIEDDLILTGSTGPRSAPFGILVIGIGALFFWAAALVHIAVAVVQEALTPSLLKLYGTVAILTGLFAMVWTADSGPQHTLLLGGNVIFVSFVVGWLLGDFFRPD